MSKNQIYVIIGAGCLLAVCAVVTLLAGIFFLTPLSGNQVIFPRSDIVSVESNTRPNPNGNSMGDPDAPIQMVEFGDFQCPFCERFAMQTEPLLVENYIKTGKVHFTFRSAGNWVSKNIGQGSTESQDAAAAAYCAADQGKFWEMHDTLFANNRDVEDQGSFSSSRLAGMAESLGLDMTEFQNCYDNGKYAEQVQQDYDDAISAGIHGTPYFVITYQVNAETKTETIDGAQPIGVFQQTIEAILRVADK